MAQAMKLALVSNVYRTDSSRFVDAYLSWLEDSQKDLSALRSPISIVLQAEKSSLTSVLDGYIPDNIQAGMSARKIQKAVAAQSLEKVSKEIYSKIESIDNILEQFSEKLCHAITVLAIRKPELYNRLQVNQQCVETIWKMLGRTPETIPTYSYFCAKLSSADINYLLIDILQKIVSNKTAALEKSAQSSKVC